MATWQEVREVLGKTFVLDGDEPDQLTLTLPLKDGRTPRAQRLMLQHFTSWGEEMIEIRSAFGELKPGEAEALLGSNLELPIGAVAAHGRFLVLVQKLPLRHVTLEGLMWALGRVAELADVLEERRGGDRF